MTSFDCRPNTPFWLVMILILLASKASSQNTTENATTMLTSMISLSESKSLFIPTTDITSFVLPTTSSLPPSVFSTIESRDLVTNQGMITTHVIPPNASEITPGETTEASVSSEMTNPSSQPSASPDLYSKSPLINLESSSMHPEPSGPDDMVSNRITPSFSTGDHLTKVSMEPHQTSNISPTDSDVNSVFEDLTTPFMMATTSVYSELTTSTMASENIGFSSSKSNIGVHSNVQDSSTANNMISKAMEASTETLLFPSSSSDLSSAVSLPSIKHSSSARERESLSTGVVHEKTIHTTVATLTTVLQPSRTAEPPMSTTVDADSLKEELSRLQKNIDDLEDEIKGWKIALVILAVCLGLILLVLIIRLIIRRRQRDKPAKMIAGGVDDITRKDLRGNENKSFFRRPGSSTFLDKGLNRISSIFNKRSSSSHELETFNGAPRPVPSVMEEVDETEVAGGQTDVQMTQFKSKGDEGNEKPKLNADGQEVRNSFTEVDLH